MGLNCRPGDLAVIVRSDPLLRNEGVIVKVDRWADARSFMNRPIGSEKGAANAKAGWICEGRHRQFARYSDGSWSVVEFEIGVIPDSELKPLRDNDEVDETLRFEYAPKAAQ